MKPVGLVFAVALAIFVVVRWRKLGRVELAAAAVAFTAALLYGLGVVHPPNIEQLILDLGKTLGVYTYVLVGVMAFLETGAFVGLVAPGEFTILLGGLVAGQGKIDVIALIGLVWACAVAGDLVSFTLGRRLGRQFLVTHGPKVKITEDRLHTVEKFFSNHGGKTILIGRFVGLVRAIAPFIAGSSGMTLRRFLPYDVIGAGLWGTTFVLLGFIFWRSFDKVASYASKGALGLGLAIALAVGIFAAVRALRDPAQRARIEGWLQAQERRRAIGPVVRAARATWARLSGPLRFTADRFTPGDWGLEVTTLVAVLAVGSFAYFGYAQTLERTLVTGGDARAFDITDAIQAGWLVSVAKVVTALGSLPAVGAVVAVAVLALARRDRVAALVLVAGLAATVGAVHVAKAAQDRPRPLEPLVHTLGSSYPSGHAAYAVLWIAVAVALARGFPRFRERAALVVAAVVLAALIGLSRVLLRAHFLSDVLGGWGLGASILALCAVAGLLADARLRHNPGP